jgi:hypothetical protein
MYREKISGGYKIHPDPKPMTPEQASAAAKLLASRLGEIDQAVETIEQRHTQALEAKRQDRLAREAFATLTPEERDLYDQEHGPVAVARRLAEQARQESDRRWMQADEQRQKDELAAWLTERQKTLPDGYRDNGQAGMKKLLELAEQGRGRAEQRLAARAKRELEAESHSDELHRFWATLDADEQKIFTQLLQAEPGALERVEQFKASARNPLEGIDDSATLYQMAMSKPQREEYVPPLAEIDSVNDSRTLYKMARKQIEQKQAT